MGEIRAAESRMADGASCNAVLIPCPPDFTGIVHILGSSGAIRIDVGDVTDNGSENALILLKA